MIWLLIVLEFSSFAVNIFISLATFCLCKLNVFNCAILREFLKLLPIPNVVRNLCMYITRAVIISQNDLRPVFKSLWKWTTGVEFKRLLLIKCLCVLGKFYPALTSVSFLVHFKTLLFFSCTDEWAKVREDAWLRALSPWKRRHAEGHFSVGESFSIGLVLVHWSNVLTLEECYIWSLGL